MDINEVRKMKAYLDEAISNMITEFERRTTLKVSDIELIRFPMYTGMVNDQQPVVVNTKVEIS